MNIRYLITAAAALVCASCAPVKHVPVQIRPVAAEQSVDYPATAIRTKREGVVILLLLVDEKGRVTKTLLEKSSGFQDLDRAAVHSSASWTYKPGTIDGVPTAFWVDAPVNFKLNVL